MLIDCDGCSMRDRACGTCMVTLLLDAPPAVHQLGEAEVQAIEVFAVAGFDVTVLEPTRDQTAHRPAARRWTAA